jgi:hypothetical protein
VFVVCTARLKHQATDLALLQGVGKQVQGDVLPLLLLCLLRLLDAGFRRICLLLLLLQAAHLAEHLPC